MENTNFSYFIESGLVLNQTTVELPYTSALRGATEIASDPFLLFNFENWYAVMLSVAKAVSGYSRMTAY
jgi:hypothetical protein